MTKRRNIVIWTALGFAVAVAAGATTMQQARAGRADCPGKVVCPLTGELVCRDRCPLGAGTTPEAEVSQASRPSCCVGAGAN